MTVYAPDYYNDFKCIADKCRHNCCIGWEIDIDSTALAFYKSVNGEIGRRLEESVCNGEEPHFILDENNRCPFLNKDNLCDIITELGEDKLCSICTDHPRFRNFFGDSVEIGLGMCCEEAARLILSQTDKMQIVQISGSDTVSFTDEECLLFNLRTQIFGIVQERSKSVLDRVRNVLDKYDIALPEKTLSEWVDFYDTLEYLDKSRKHYFESLKSTKFGALSSELDTAFEQLLVYFFYRHLSDALWDNLFKERILFAIHSFYMIYAICAAQKSIKKELLLEDICEIARMYSSEIEYNEENVNSILKVLSK